MTSCSLFVGGGTQETCYAAHMLCETIPNGT